MATDEKTVSVHPWPAPAMPITAKKAVATPQSTPPVSPRPTRQARFCSRTLPPHRLTAYRPRSADRPATPTVPGPPAGGQAVAGRGRREGGGRPAVDVAGRQAGRG